MKKILKIFSALTLAICFCFNAKSPIIAHDNSEPMIMPRSVVRNYSTDLGIRHVFNDGYVHILVHISGTYYLNPGTGVYDWSVNATNPYHNDGVKYTATNIRVTSKYGEAVGNNLRVTVCVAYTVNGQSYEDCGSKTV